MPHALRYVASRAILVLICAVCFGVLLACGANAATQDHPNVLILVADDLRADCVGALGGGRVKTPNLDGLVERGFAFRNAYCLGANQGAVCTPSRNMLISGQAYFRWQGKMADPTGPSLPTAFKAAGYETYRDGKAGNVATAINALFDHNQSLANDQQERTSGEPGHTITDRAIGFLDKRSVQENASQKPFCMLLEYEAPHDPRVANPKYLALYERDQIALPKNSQPVHPFDNGEMAVRDEQLAPWPRTDDAIRRQLHEYYAVISGLDAHIGRLLATLERLKLREDTLIVFVSDHGLAIGSHGLMGKQNLYEVSMKAPLVFCGPGVPHGQSRALVYLYDILPTVCELAGVKIPADEDGKSLAPIIAGRADQVRDSLFTAYRDVQRAVRDDRWKIIRYPKIDRTQLFDLQTDPHEIHDLAANPAQADRIAELTALMEKWQRDYGDTAPLVVKNPADGKFTPPAGAARK
jgi:arylsulfatase A-like enzyme